MASRLSSLGRRFYTLKGSSAVSGEFGGERRWKLLSCLVGFPGLALCFVNAYYFADHPKVPEFVAFSHLRLRTKKFPWGDGNHTLFHNPHTNPLPEGFEEPKAASEDES